MRRSGTPSRLHSTPRTAPPEDAVLASDHDPWLFLTTGRRGALLVPPVHENLGHPDRWRPWLQAFGPQVVRDWRKIGVTHAVTILGLVPWTATILDNFEAQGHGRSIRHGRRADFEVLALRLGG